MPMDPELPDLDPPTPYEKRVRVLRDQLAALPVLAALLPWVLLYLALTQGLDFWPVTPCFVGGNAGLALMFLGWRRERRVLVRAGGFCMAAGFAASLAVRLLTT